MRTRFALLSAFTLVAASCSSGGARDGGLNESADMAMAAGEDGSVLGVDLGGARDLAGDLSPPPLDPATCPIGASDGCCPLLRYGGTDPDCPKLDCTKFTQSADILLEPMGMGVGNAGAGQVGMAWSGRELSLAWTYTETPGDNRVIFERRNQDGDLVYGPVQSAIPVEAGPVVNGPTALVYEPSRNSYVLGHTATALKYAAMGLDGSGKTTWGLGLGELCNALWLYIDGYSVSSGAKVAIGQQNQTCAGSTYQPRIDTFDWDGKNQQTFWLGDGKAADETLYGMFAYQPKDNRLLTIYSRWSEHTIGGRYLDLMGDGKVLPGFDLRGAENIDPWEHLGLAFDGQRYGVVFEYRPAYSSFTQSFQIWHPVMGWQGSPVQFAAPRAMLAPSVLWTGDGYLVAMMTFVGPDTPLSNLEKFTSTIFRFGADGTALGSYVVDSNPAIYPKLLWVGGRVALTYVRVSATGSTTGHYLRYLSCP